MRRSGGKGRTGSGRQPRLDRLLLWLDVRPGEGTIVLLLALAAFCVIGAHLLLKPVSKGVFLATHGAAAMPRVYLWAAVVVAVVGGVYARLARRLSIGWMVGGVLLALAGCTVAFGWLLRRPGGEQQAAYAFVVFGSVYGVFSTALTWLTVNHALEPRQARRLIGYVGAGAILGGIAGGYLVSLTARWLGSENLTWVATGLQLVALAALAASLRRPRLPLSDRPRRRERMTSALGLIRDHTYLRLLLLLVATITLCAGLADWQFTWAVEQWAVGQGGDRTDAMAQYMGFWYSTISVLALPAQLLVAAPLLRRFGIGPALVALPAAIAALAAGMVVAPGVAFGTGLKLGDGVMRHSVNKSAVELLYLPLPTWLKDRTKVFLDTTFDRLAKGAAGLLLILLLDVLGLGVRGVGGMTLLLAVTWIGLSLVARRRYVQAFRDALDRGAVDLAEQLVRLDEPGAVRAVAEVLDGSDAVAMRRSLEMLAETGDPPAAALRDRLPALARHGDPAVVAVALDLGSRSPTAALAAAAEDALAHPTAAVASAAARVLAAAWPGEPEAFLAEMAARGPGREALAAAGLLALGRDLPDPVIERLLADDAMEAAVARRELALRLCEGDLPHRVHLLHRLLVDPSPEVASAALAGAGRLRDPALLPFILVGLRRPVTRPAARAALVDLGPGVIPVISAHLQDERVEHAVRRRLPRVLSETGHLDAHAQLVRALSLEDPTLRQAALRALNRMQERDPALHVPEAVIESEILAECRALAELLACVAERGGSGPARRLFERSVRDAVRQARERAFRLLGLRGQARAWENAFAGLYGEDARLRASAVEFTDGSLPEKLRRVVVPLIDDIAAAEALQRVSRQLRVRPLPPAEAYRVAAAGADRWVAACGLLAGAEEGERAILDVVERRRDDPDPWVRDAARLAEARLAP